MDVGDVTDPVPLGPAIAIFQLRGLDETGFVSPVVTAVEYAEVLIPGGQSAEALAEALMRLGEDEPLAQQLASSGHTHVTKSFDIDTCLEPLLRQFRMALESRS